MANAIVGMFLNLEDGFTKTLQGAVAGLNQLRGAAQQLQSALSPLNGTISTLIAGYVGLNAIRQSIAAGRQEEQAEARLAVQLKGNNVLLEERIKKAQQMSQSGAGGLFKKQEITEAEAMLRVFGVTDSQIDTAMAAVVNRAAAFNTSLDTQVQQIGRTFESGMIGRLSRTEHELAGLSQASLRAGDQFQILADKYAGTAQRLAAGPFGQAIVQQNRLNEVYAQLGRTFIQIQNAVLPQLTAAFQRLADSLNSPGGQRGIQLLSSLLGFIAGHADTIITVFLSLKGLSILSSIVTSVPTILSLVFGFLQWAALPAILLAMGVQLGVVLAQVRGTQVSLSDIPKIISDINARVKDGTITGGQAGGLIWTNVKTEIQVLWETIKTYLIDMPRASFTVLFGWVVSEYDLVIDRIKLAMLTAKGLLGNVQAQRDALALAQSIKALEAANADPLGRGDKAAEDVRTGLDARIVAIRAAADAAQAARTKELSDAAGDAAVKKMRADSENKINQMLVARIDLDKQLATAESAGPLLTTKQTVTTGLERLKADYEDRKMLLKDYLAAKDALEVKDQQEEVAGYKAAIEKVHALRLSNMAEEATIRAKGGGNAALTSEINKEYVEETSLLQKMREVQGEIAVIQAKQGVENAKLLRQEKDKIDQLLMEADIKRLQASNELSDKQLAERIKLSNDQRKEMVAAAGHLNDLQMQELKSAQFAEDRRLLADQAVEREVQAASDLSLITKSNDAAVQGYQLSQVEAWERNQVAFDKYKESVAEVVRTLESLKASATDPRTAAGIQRMIDEIHLHAQEAANSIGLVGKTIGDTVQGPLANTFSSIIQGTKDARTAFADFFKSIAAGLADMAAKMLANIIITRALKAAGLAAAAGANEGGLVPSNVMLTTGEIVVPPGEVARIGVPTLSRLNRMSGGDSGWGPDRDTVPAMVPPGSYVLRRRAANALRGLSAGAGAILGFLVGPQGLRSASAYKGYNIGGLVSEAMYSSLDSQYPAVQVGQYRVNNSGSGPAVPINAGHPAIAALVADHQSADRLFKGGDNALIEAFGRNREAIRNLLGISR